MNLKIQVKNNKILTEVPLEDDTYQIKIYPNRNKTLRDYQEELFVCIDEYCVHSGNSRYDIWGAFKKENEITSSRNIPLEEFPMIIEKLKFYLISIS